MALSYRNPVYPRYFADPFVWRHQGLYHAIGTGPEEAEGAAADAVFPVLVSQDLASWRPAGRALVRPDPGLGDTFWAPEVAFHQGIFWLYYSVGRQDRGHQLRVATSEAPAGPYRDLGPLTDPSDCPFAIDPHPFRDADGRWYLFHARDFLDTERPGTSLVVQPLEGMIRLMDPPRVVLRARHDWQRFERDRPMYGAIHDWHTLEGPAVLLRDGRYLLFYSGGRWSDRSYGVDYAVADRVLGPYREPEGGEGPRILRSTPEAIGPGHNSLVTGPDGRTWLAYHAWDPELRARRMCVDPIDWGPDGPQRSGPSSTTRWIG